MVIVTSGERGRFCRFSFGFKRFRASDAPECEKHAYVAPEFKKCILLSAETICCAVFGGLQLLSAEIALRAMFGGLQLLNAHTALQAVFGGLQLLSTEIALRAMLGGLAVRSAQCSAACTC